MSDNDGHLGCRAVSPDTILKGDKSKDHSSNLVPIDQVVSEELYKRFFHMLKKLCRLMSGGVIGYNSETGPPMDHSTKVWFKLAKQFQR